MNPRFKQLVQFMRLFPGVGPRQGARFILSLLDRNENELRDLGNAIATLKQSLRLCSQCYNIADEDLCSVCADSARDRNTILVIEKATDLDAIERAKFYRGLYHVLGGAINPVAGVPLDAVRVKELVQRVSQINTGGAKIEVILATSTTTAGDATALYIQDQLSRLPISITRLARGLSSGATLEYADEGTLKHAIEQRR